MELIKITLEDRRVLFRQLEGPTEIFDFVRPPKKGQVRDWEIVTGNELLRRSELKLAKLYLRLVPDNSRETKRYDIHPYVIGALLGDGSLIGGTITLCKPYIEFINRVRRLLPDEYQINTIADCTHSIVSKESISVSFKTLIERLGLHKTSSSNKFIPHSYTQGNYEQRLELLRGLLDSDGTVSTVKSVSFYSASASLALGVMYLVWGLGGVAKTSKSTRTTKIFNGEEKPILAEYRVRIKFPRPWELFTIPHKAERLAEGSRFSQNPKIKIVSVELVEVDEHFICSGDPFYYGGVHD